MLACRVEDMFQSPTLVVQLNDLATAVHRVELSRKLLLVLCAVSNVLLIGIKNTNRALPQLLSCLDAFFFKASGEEGRSQEATLLSLLRRCLQSGVNIFSSRETTFSSTFSQKGFISFTHTL